MMNQIKAGAVLSYISLFLTTFLGIIYTPFMLRQMGQSEFGLYSLAASVIAYLTLFDFGFGNAVIRFTAKFRAEGKMQEQYEMFGMFLILYSVIALLASAAGYCLWANADSMFGTTMSAEELFRAKVILAILVANVAITFPFTIFRSIITAYEDFIFQRALNIARILLQTGIMIPLLLWGYKAIALSLLITALNVATLLADTVYCFRKIKVKIYFTNMKWGLLRELSGYSFYIFLGVIMDRIYWSSGQFILGSTSGMNAAAVYAVAVRIITFFIAISGAIPGVLLPKLTAMIAKNASNKEVSDLFIRAGRIQFLIVGLAFSGFFVFGKTFVSLWAGAGYDDAYVCSVILMGALLPALIQNTGIAILQARDQLRFRAVLYVIVASACLGLGYVLSRSLGGIGCAMGTALSLFIGNGVIINWYYWKKININIPLFWWQICKAAFPLIILGSVAMVINTVITDSCMVTYLTKIAVFSSVALGALWFFSMNSYEKVLVRGSFQKILQKTRIVRGIL